MVAAARPGFDPYAGLVVEAGSIFSAVRRVARAVAKPAGATFRAAAKTAPGKAAIQMAKLGGPVPLLGVVPGASAAVDRGLEAVSRGNITGARRAAVAAGVELAPVVQQALKSFGPPGLAASAAIGALAAGTKGANMEEIAWAAAEGGAPQGIDTAIKAAHEIRRGGSPANVALSLMSQNLVPGSPAAQGFNLAQTVLSGNASGATAEIMTKLAASRRTLPNEQSRRGFDLAIGTVSRAVKKGGTVPKKRPLAGARVPIASRARMMTAMGGAHELARSRLEKDPALARESLATVVRTLKVSPVTARQALRTVRSRFRWRPLTSLAARFVERHAPTAARVALRDTSGLSDANTIYVVEPGDFPVRIGDKLLGAGQGNKRWKELVRANPQKSVDPKTGNFKILAVGERLKLPASWTAEINARTGVTSTPVVTISAPAPVPSGARFVVVLKNEGPFQIAQALTGDGNRRKELTAANFPRDADGRARKSDGAGGFSPGLNPGDRLFVPVTWPAHARAIGLAPAPVPTTSLPTVPLPTPVSTLPAPGPSEDLSTILQAKAILAAWGKTDGLNEAGLPDYGARAEDVSGVFASRDRFMLASFASWSNRTQGTRLSSSGDFLPEHAEALRAWAEKRAGIPLPSATLPSSPGAPPVVVSLPVPAPPGATPAPTATPPAKTEPGPTTAPPGPTPAPPGAPSAPSSPAKKDEGGGAALLAVAIPLAAALLS